MYFCEYIPSSLGENCPLVNEWLMNGTVALSAGFPGVGPDVEDIGHKLLPAQIYGLGLMASASSSGGF